MTTATATEVEQAYLAYFGRPADLGGMNYWLGKSVAEMDAGFAASQEYANLYSGMTNDQRVEQVYQNLFGRPSDPAGKAYWVNQLNTGQATIGTLVSTMEANALGVDVGTINNRLTFAINFTASLTPAQDAGYSGTVSANAARAAVSEVTYTDASLATARANMALDITAVDLGETPATLAAANAAAAAAAAAAAIAAAGGAAAVSAVATGASATFTLTTGIDKFTGGTGNDIFNGTWWDGAGISTFNPGDVLIGGGGTDTLNITTASAGAMTLTGANWNAGDSGFTTLNITNTGNGAITLDSGANFDAAFSTGHLNLTTKIDGNAAMTIDLATSPYTGTATIISTVIGNGAQTITTGAGLSTVVAATHDGATTVNGTGLTSVQITSDAGGTNAQTVGSVGLTDYLATIDVTQYGAGAQAVTSTDSSAVTINAIIETGGSGAQTITAMNSSGAIVNATDNGTSIDAQTIVTGGGADTITMLGSNLANTVSITGGAGADTITLVALHTGIDTIHYTANNQGGAALTITAGGTLAAGDTVANFVLAKDIVDVSGVTAQVHTAFAGTLLNAWNFATDNVFIDTATTLAGAAATVANVSALIGTVTTAIATDTGFVAIQTGAATNVWDILQVVSASGAHAATALATTDTISLVGQVTTTGALTTANFHA